MPQIGIIKLETQSGAVEVPIYSEGDSGSGVYEFLKVQTESGTGFIPLVEPAEAEYNYIRVQTESNGVVAVHNETALGITEIQSYLEDDWNDNVLANRSSKSDGVYPHPEVNEAGNVLIGRYRPEWNKIEGVTSASSGYMTCEQVKNHSVVSTTSNLYTGEWKIDFRNQTNVDGSAGYGNATYLKTGRNPGRHTSDGDYYRYTHQTAVNKRSFQKYKDGSGTSLISTGGGVGTAWNTHKRTRDSYGSWECLFNGSSEGTSTDAFLPKMNFIVNTSISDNGNGGSAVDYDNLKVK